MDADGNNPIRLTNNAANDWSPAWSPDGQRIAFISDRDGLFRIYLMDVDGDNLTLFRYSRYYNLWSPVWSPDGQHIAYIIGHQDDDIGDLKTWDGKSRYQTGIDDDDCWSPAWSPDGQRIAFVDACNIEIRDADGSDQVVLIDVSGCRSQFTTRSPVWSPNGRQIAFYLYAPDPNFDIYVVEADGSDLTRLTSHSANDEFPVWSPFGNRIAFHSDRAGNRDIYVMDANGGNLTRLTEHAADDEFPVWSPDGSRIAFVSFRDGHKEIYVIDVD